MSSLEIRIMGGLGNQLYQFAAARYVQKKYNIDNIVVDTRGYDNYKIRDLELNSILENPCVSFERPKSLMRSLIREGFHCFQKVYRTVGKKHCPMSVWNICGTTYILSSVEFDINKLKKTNNNRFFLYGYFVNAKIAEEIKHELLNEIRAPKQCSDEYWKLINTINNRESIGVSIRCGEDYRVNSWPICSKTFYIEGIKRILEARPNCKILVFADDVDKVIKENWFQDFDVMFVKGLTVCESFDLLRSCSNYVCSNSSFSWWGAFLSKSMNPMIINPNKIFGGKSYYLDRNIFRKDMILLDYETGQLVGE